MFIEDIRNDFYNVLLGNRVLLLVHYDVDAICTCKILQELFKCDNIPYTLVPVGDIEELKTAYEENNEETKYVVLVNCGGTIDIVDILQPDEDVVFFILDSHKPTDVCNVYSDGQVRLVYKDSDENIPNFDDIFRDDEEEETEDAEGGRAGLEAAVERRRERRVWEEKRHTLMFNYTQFSYYGKPSGLVALELCWRLSRVSTSALWAASVAAAAAAETYARDGPRCLLDAESLHRHISVAAGAAAGKDHGARVVVEKELRLPLYRRWSLWESLRHSPHVAPRLLLHTPQGDAVLRRTVAHIGIPLQQARQSYRSMDVSLRHELLPALERAAATLPALSGSDVTRTGFVLRAPLAQDVAAQDLVYVIMGLVFNECSTRSAGFQLALSCLGVGGAGGGGGGGGSGGGGDGEGPGGEQLARRALAAVQSVVNSALSGKMLRHAGPFSYFVVPEGTVECRLIASPFWLSVAARWMSSAQRCARAVLAACPLTTPTTLTTSTTSTTPAVPTTLVLGVPPHYTQDNRNLFGAAFENAASRSGASVSLSHFDSTVVTLPTSQCPQFLDALTALLS